MIVTMKTPIWTMILALLWTSLACATPSLQQRVSLSGQPVGLCISSQNQFFLCLRSTHVVEKRDASGTLLNTLTPPAPYTDTFDPLVCVLDSQSNLYVLDNANNHIFKFDSHDNYVKVIGSSGLGNGQLSNPLGLLVTSQNRLLVVENANHRFQLLDNNGNYIAKYTIPGDQGITLGIAQDSSGNVYTADDNANLIRKYDSSFTYQSAIPTQSAFPYAPVILSLYGHYLLISDFGGNLYKLNLNKTQFSYQVVGSPSKQWSGGAEDASGNLWLNDYSNKFFEKYTQIHGVNQATANTNSHTPTASIAWQNPTDSDLALIQLYRGNTLLTQGSSITQYIDTPAQDGSYTYTLYTTNTQGNRSTPNTLSVTITGNPPSPAQNFTASVVGNIISLAWTTTGNNGFNGVTIRRDTTAYPSTILAGTAVTINSRANSLTEHKLPNAHYYYAIFTLDNLGNSSTKATADATISQSGILPDRPLNYPNPFKFSQGTTIGYWLNQNISTELRVYTTTGSEVWRKTFVSGVDQGATGGYNRILLNHATISRTWPSGIYTYVIIANSQVIGKGKLAVLPE